MIPESPRYQAYCHHHESLNFRDVESNAIKKQNVLWTHEDLQRKTVCNLISELREKSLCSVIGLIFFEQFIGGISILFYMKKFAVLTGSFISSQFTRTRLTDWGFIHSSFIIDRRWIFIRNCLDPGWAYDRAKHPNLQGLPVTPNQIHQIAGIYWRDNNKGWGSK